jgi:RNA polymerase sigma-70 factor (family 1)
MLNDEQLIGFLKGSDEVSFEEIYHRYWYKIYGVAYREIGIKEDAEELVEDLFESLWNRREVATINHLGSYLMASIKHQATNYIKSQITHRKFQEHLIFHEIRQSFSTEEIVNFTDLSQAVDAAMMKLPEKTLQVFKMSRFENQPVRHIAEQLNLSEKAVEYHITKSLKILKDSLKHYSPN